MRKLNGNQRKEIVLILIAFVLFAALMVIEHMHLLTFFDEKPLYLFAGYLLPYLIVGGDVVRKCLLSIKNRQLFDEKFLMTLATVGAFATGEYGEAVAVMLFYQIGEFFQDYAVGKSRNSIQDLLSIAPEFANVERANGSVETIDPDDVEIGDILVIRPGEKIPVDGTVISGEGLVNTSALTGESMPRDVSPGDAVISGFVNGDNLLRLRADKLYDDSTVALVLELVENAANKKSNTEAFITRFARYYTPIVVIGALLLAFIPPIFSGNLGEWIHRACTFLVISCPCALVISVPLAFFGGIGAASRKGVLVKGSNYLELMASVNTVVSDKTGTLTKGVFKISEIEPAEGISEDELFRYAAIAESGSTHPIAVSICEGYEKYEKGGARFDASDISELENYSGKGISVKYGDTEIIAGKLDLLKSKGVTLDESQIKLEGSYVLVAVNGKYAGKIEVLDEPKSEAKAAIAEMKREGVRRVVMLTGDSKYTADKIAKILFLDDYRAELLPQDKMSELEKLLKDLAGNKKAKLAFVGDGINDAPVLKRADVGIAMGSIGSDAAIEAADIVIMDDDLSKIPTLIRIARKTILISKTNIVFALLIKCMCLLLGALGIVGMWAAVFADVGVAFICIINSMRMLTKKRA